MAGSVTIVEPDSGDASPLTDAGRLEATWRQSLALRQLSAEAIASARTTRDRILRGRSRREVLHESAFARLQAKHETMPVIEQAKGILMAQQRCGPDKGFDLLRQASQRANVKVHVLAAQIVEHIASGDEGGTVTPIALDAMKYGAIMTADPMLP